MRRKLILIILLSWPSFVYALTGLGTEQNPFLIQSLTDFDEFASDPNYWDDHILLKCDIDLAGRTYTEAVIAPNLDPFAGFHFDGIPFTGVFNGNSHRLLNLTIDTGGISNDFLGLFGMISGQQAHVKKLKLENVSITGANFNDLDYSVNCGALCGELHDATVSDCYVNGSVSKASGIGGLCGENFQGTISNCFANVTVTGYGTCGGLCGINWSGTIINCHVAGSVISDVRSILMGGLCGHNYFFATISNCSSSASVSVIDGQYSVALGGFCGSNYYYSVIDSCFATGSITSGINSHSLGGLCGSNSMSVLSNSYAAGSIVSGESSVGIGGLCGGNGSESTIENCYAVGFITSGEDSENLGGLCGSSSEETISDCYFLNTSGPDNGLGIPLDDPNMMIQSNFTGWDFVGEDINGTNDIWRMCADDIHYPHLWWQYSINGDFACPDGVGTDDLLALSRNWLNTEELDPGFSYPLDPTFDGITNLADFVILAQNWLESY